MAKKIPTPKTLKEAAKYANRFGNFIFKGEGYNVGRDGQIRNRPLTVAERGNLVSSKEMRQDMVEARGSGRRTEKLKVTTASDKPVVGEAKPRGSISLEAKSGSARLKAVRLTAEQRARNEKMFADNEKARLAREGKVKKPVGRPRKDGTPAQSKKAAASVESAPQSKIERAVAQVNAEIPDKPKTPRKPLGKGGTKPATAPIGGPKAPNRKPKAPKAPSQPRNRAPKVEKPVSPRLEMKSEFSKIKRNIETSIRQGEKKAASKASKAAKPTPSLKADSAPKKRSTGPKAQTKPTTPSASSKSSKTSPRTPKAPSASSAAAVRAVDAEMARVNANYAAGKITKAERNAAAKANAARRAAAMKGELPGSSVVKSGGVKTVKEGVRRPTVSKSSGKSVVPRTTTRGGAAPSSRLAITSGKNNVVKINGKLFRIVGKTLEPVAIASMLYDKAQDPLGKKEIARAQAWKKANPNASLWDATVASVKDVFGFDDTPSKKKKATPRKPVSPAARNVRPRGESYTPSTSKNVRPRNESYTPPKRKAPVAPRGPQKPSGPSSSNYTPRGSVRIKRGDTLWDLAQKNNTTVSAIYKANPELARRKAAGKVQIFRNTLVKIPGKK